MKLFNKDKLPSSEAIRYAEEQTKIYKQQVIKATNDYIKLQSNWNSLRELIIKRLDKYDRLVSKEEGIEIEILMWVRNKMNELEGKDKDNV